MTVENISWSISTKEYCQTRLGLNPWPPGLQSDGVSNWATEAGYFIFDLQGGKCFLSSFKSIGLPAQEKKRVTDFQDGRMTLTIFDLQVTLIFPTKFQVYWPFGSEEAKKIFSRCRPSWISDHNSFSYFWFTSHPDASYQVSSQLAFLFKRRSEKLIFKMAAMVAIMYFRLE